MKEPKTVEELYDLGESISAMMRETRSLDVNDKASHRRTEILATVGALLTYDMLKMKKILSSDDKHIMDILWEKK